MEEGADWLAVGQVRRPHGIHGEVGVAVVTDFPERLVAGMEVGIGKDGPTRRLAVTSVRWHKGAWLLAFDGVTTRDEVEPWRGEWIYLPAQPRGDLPPTYFYEHELAGLECRRTDGAVLGTVTSLTGGVGPSLLHVAGPDGEVLVPFISPIVVRVDLASGVVVLDPPGGLFDGDAL